MSFPNFPQFRRLSINDRVEYLQYYAMLNEPYSDFSVDDILIWLNFHDDLSVSDLNGNLVIQFTNVFDNNTVHFSLIGTKITRIVLDTLRNYLASLSSSPKLSFIPEPIAQIMREVNPPYLSIEEDIDNSDYVYKVNDFVAMEGRPYRNLRERVRNFKRDHQDIKIKALDLTQQSTKALVEQYVHEWSNKDSAFMRNDPEKWEETALRKHLQLANQLPMHAIGLYVQDHLVSIIIFNIPPQDGWIIVNHVKCNYSYNGIFGYASYTLALVAQQLGIQWINFEQDLGQEGLRRIKTFFRPYKFLRRYTVSFEPEAKYQ